ncbi:MAG: penicillin-binding transpeptidase domain-containing protein [Alphaproteobacteria bacterium]
MGTFEVKVIDMAAAYSVIANGGFSTWPHAIKEIYSKDGYQLYQRGGDDKMRIIDGGDAEELTQMLSKVLKGGTGKRACTALLCRRKNRNITGQPRRLVCGLYGRLNLRRMARQMTTTAR